MLSHIERASLENGFVIVPYVCKQNLDIVGCQMSAGSHDCEPCETILLAVRDMKSYLETCPQLKK